MKAISSIHNETVQHLIGLAKNSDYRREYKSLLLEGKNAILDLSKTMKLKRLVVTDQNLIPEQLHAEEILVVTDAIMDKISSVKTHEGFIAELPFPEMPPLNKKSRILALDRVRDPGNLGTLLRTALALGWEGIFFLPGCCDPFGDKALRSAKGATFQIPLQQGEWSDLQKLAEDNHMTLLAADMNGSPALNQYCKEKIILILGNEGEGVCIPSHISYQSVAIPMSTGMSSLNVAVAGGIFMYLLQEKAEDRI